MRASQLAKLLLDNAEEFGDLEVWTDGRNVQEVLLENAEGEVFYEL